MSSNLRFKFHALLLLLLLSLAASNMPRKYPADDYISPVDFVNANCSKNDVTFRLFNNSSDGNIVDETTVKSISIDKNLPVKFVIHGWKNNGTSPWYHAITAEYLKRGPHNIVHVDWEPAAGKLYSISTANTKFIGEYIADFIIAAEFNATKVHVIGYSLGAHVAGFTGKFVQKKLGVKLDRITGLDVGKPKFDEVAGDSRFDVSDAQFVDVVHTDDDHYGNAKPLGHVDFYPNGGKNQPGCPPLDVDDNCSHQRSTEFFVESVNSKILAKSAMSWEDFEKEIVSEAEDIVFGEDTPHTARGRYYFRTNTGPPFAIK